MKNRRFLSYFIAIALLLATSLNETNAQFAKWDDQSDELPGMMSDGEMLLLAGGAVLLIGALVTVLIIKKKQDKELDSSINDTLKSGLLGSVNITNNGRNSRSSLYSDISKASDQASVMLFTRCSSIPNQNLSPKQAMSVGIRVTF